MIGWIILGVLVYSGCCLLSLGWLNGYWKLSYPLTYEGIDGFDVALSMLGPVSVGGVALFFSIAALQPKNAYRWSLRK